MSSQHSLWMALLVAPVSLMAQGTSSRPHQSAGHSASVARSSVKAPSGVTVAVLPVDPAGGDSVRAIIARDFDFGDRIRVVSPDAPSRPSALVQAVPSTQGLTVSLLDPATRNVRQVREFVLPVVTAPRDSAITDSVARALWSRDVARQAELVRTAAISDSLRAVMAKKAPRLRGDKAKHAYALVVAERDSLLHSVIAQDSLIRADARADSAAQPAALKSELARDVLRRDSLAIARRWAIHGIADEVESWITGRRGIAQSRVAYISNGEVRVVDIDGANDHSVTRTTTGKAMSPSWRRDGRAIVYADMNDSGTQIAWVDLLTGQSHFVDATRRGLNITPIFSHDDQWIVYANGDDFRTGLVAVRPDSVNSLKHITVNHAFDSAEPAMSPDGVRIAYVSPRPKTPLIYSANMDGSDERVETPVLTKARTYRTSPDWSPDGKMIAFEQQNGDFQVWLVTRADRKLRKLTTTGENEDPTWAPDARHLALTSNRGGSKAIWVLDTQSGRLRQLTRGGDARLAAWSGLVGSASVTPVAANATPTVTSAPKVGASR